MAEATRTDRLLDAVHDYLPKRAQIWIEDRAFFKSINQDFKEMDRASASERQRVDALVAESQKNWNALPEADKADIDRRLDAHVAHVEQPRAVEPKIASSPAEIEPDYAQMMEDMRPKPYTQTFGVDEEGRLHMDPRDGPAQEIVTEQDWGYGAGSTDRTELYVVHGELVARAEIQSGRDEEGSWSRETWYDAAGEKHSFNGNPAEIIYSNHYIPSETYLDESIERFYNHGKEVDSVDRTYEDILSHKPITVRQAFGEDLDGERHQITDKPEYPNRFDALPHAEAPEIREDRFTEITRKYGEATHSGDTQVQPTITKPAELESYRQEQLFQGKHTEEQRAAESWRKDAGESYMAELASRPESNVDRRQMEMWATKQEQNRAAWAVASPVTHERQQETQANTMTLKP